MTNCQKRVATAPLGVITAGNEAYKVCGAYGMPDSLKKNFKKRGFGGLGLWTQGPGLRAQDRGHTLQGSL